MKKIQQGFPDIVALRRIDEQTWQEVKVEAEYESRNFLRHGHLPSGCDVLVCWIHNWPECPVEVNRVEQGMEGVGVGNGVREKRQKIIANAKRIMF